MEKRDEDREDTRQTLHDLMGRRWKVSMLTGPAAGRVMVTVRNTWPVADSMICIVSVTCATG